MRLVSILILLLVVGCATPPTLEELEAEAVASGDWKAVEDRERIIRKIGSPLHQQCPEGLALFCLKNGMHEVCSCEPLPTGD